MCSRACYCHSSCSLSFGPSAISYFLVSLAVRYGYVRFSQWNVKGNEAELYKMIHENDNLADAVVVAIKVFAAFLAQHAEDPMLPADDLLESV